MVDLFLFYQWEIQQQPLSTVIIGGQGRVLTVNSIYQLVDGKWVEIGSMTSDRNFCLVASPTPDKIIILGGYELFGTQDGTVEECVVV